VSKRSGGAEGAYKPHGFPHMRGGGDRGRLCGPFSMPTKEALARAAVTATKISKKTARHPRHNFEPKKKKKDAYKRREEEEREEAAKGMHRELPAWAQVAAAEKKPRLNPDPLVHGSPSRVTRDPPDRRNMMSGLEDLGRQCLISEGPRKSRKYRAKSAGRRRVPLSARSPRPLTPQAPRLAGAGLSGNPSPVIALAPSQREIPWTAAGRTGARMTKSNRGQAHENGSTRENRPT